MSGAGNDFILGDNRNGLWSFYDLKRMIPLICERGTGVGADGVILLENSKKAAFRIRIYNRDGGEADFCGNGLRCSARYAMLKVIAGKRMNIETPVGVAEAELISESEVMINFQMKTADPRLLELDADGRKLRGYYVAAGVPHFILFVRDIESAPLQEMAPFIRSHPSLPAGGANVDFMTYDSEPYPYRTYERGVEGETLACGSGALAIGWMLAKSFKKRGPLKLITRSKKILEVAFDNEKTGLVGASLKGEASYVYKAALSDEIVRAFQK
jgi:diaminopimelate epimerase